MSLTPILPIFPWNFGFFSEVQISPRPAFCPGEDYGDVSPIRCLVRQLPKVQWFISTGLYRGLEQRFHDDNNNTTWSGWFDGNWWKLNQEVFTLASSPTFGTRNHRLHVMKDVAGLSINQNYTLLYEYVRNMFETCGQCCCKIMGSTRPGKHTKSYWTWPSRNSEFSH